MPTTQFLPLIKPQFFDDNGAPLSNGLVYTYLAGTNTLALSYQDRAGNTPNTNPVVLDASGRADIYLDMSLRYKLTVADADDVPLYTVDKVYLDSGDIEYDPLVSYGAGSVGSALNDVDAFIAGLDDVYTPADAACTGAITATTGWSLTKVANVVTLRIQPVSGVATAAPSFTLGEVVPTRYRSSSLLSFVVPIQDNGSNSTTPGMVLINPSTGAITVYKDLSGLGNFTNAAAAGIGQSSSVTLTWTV